MRSQPTAPQRARLLGDAAVVGRFALFGFALVACSSSSANGVGDGSADGGATDGAAVGDGAVVRADAGIATAQKPALAGLVDMQDISWHDTAGAEPAFTIANVNQFAGIFGGIVINATWDAIQPTDAGALDFSTIDAALAQVSQYNVAHPAAPLGTKLRVYGGANAPAWAKAIGGGPVNIVRNAQGCASGTCPLTIGKLWSADYIAAWRAFQVQLAARYDTDPLVRHITVTSCAQQTDEPFVSTTDPTSQGNLANAGFTDALQKACLEGAIDDYAAWKLTNVDYTFNAYVPTTGPADATTFPESVIAMCRAKLGSRCVLGNHALSAPLRLADSSVYTAIGGAGAPISFQTASPQKMGCLWTQTIAQGVALGSESIELWPEAKFQGFDSLTTAQVTALAAELVMPIPVDPNPMPLPSPCSGFH